MKSSGDTPVKLFETQDGWHQWLDKHCVQSQGLWLKFAKKDSGKKSLSYDEALEEALCYGWIDSKAQAFNEQYWIQKFTPRGPRSIWSKGNVRKVEALLSAGKIQPSGLAAINVAKQSGAWKAAYDSPSAIKMPPDFRAALDNNPKAKAFYATLNKANVYGFCWRIQTAKKPETRLSRIAKFIDMLNAGKKLH